MKSLNVLIMFINLFRGVLLNDSSVLENGFDGVMRVPFVYEEEDSDRDIPSALVAKLGDCLRKTEGNLSSV